MNMVLCHEGKDKRSVRHRERERGGGTKAPERPDADNTSRINVATIQAHIFYIKRGKKTAAVSRLKI